MDKLEGGGLVPLWSGWQIKLPPACFERNEDWSWSAWGADWTLDISIVDTSGDSEGNPVSAEELRGEVGTDSAFEGEGWIGSSRLIVESQDNKRVFRLSAKLCAQNTVMLCTASFFNENQVEFSISLLKGIRHGASSYT